MAFTVFSGEKMYYYGKYVHTKWKVIKTVRVYARALDIVTQEIKTDLNNWSPAVTIKNQWEHANGIKALKVEGV